MNEKSVILRSRLIFFATNVNYSIIDLERTVQLKYSRVINRDTNLDLSIMNKFLYEEVKHNMAASIKLLPSKPVLTKVLPMSRNFNVLPAAWKLKLKRKLICTTKVVGAIAY